MHQIRIPMFVAKELGEMARWMDPNPKLGWTECRTIKRDGELWTGFPTYWLPWNMPDRPVKRKKL